MHDFSAVNMFKCLWARDFTPKLQWQGHIDGGQGKPEFEHVSSVGSFWNLAGVRLLCHSPWTQSCICACTVPKAHDHHCWTSITLTRVAGGKPYIVGLNHIAWLCHPGKHSQLIRHQPISTIMTVTDVLFQLVTYRWNISEMWHCYTPY